MTTTSAESVMFASRHVEIRYKTIRDSSYLYSLLGVDFSVSSGRTTETPYLNLLETVTINSQQNNRN